EALERIALRGLIDGDERGADRRLHPVCRALEAVRPRLDRRGPAHGRHRRLLLLLADTDVEHLLALAAIAEHRDAETSQLPRELVGSRHLVLSGPIGKVDRLRHAVVGVPLECGLVPAVLLEAALVLCIEDVGGALRDAGDAVKRAAL